MLECWPCPSSMCLVKGSGPAGLVSSLQKALCSFAYAEAGIGSLWMSRSRKEKKACFLLVRYPYSHWKARKKCCTSVQLLERLFLHRDTKKLHANALQFKKKCIVTSVLNLFLNCIRKYEIAKWHLGAKKQEIFICPSVLPVQNKEKNQSRMLPPAITH